MNKKRLTLKKGIERAYSMALCRAVFVVPPPRKIDLY